MERVFIVFLTIIMATYLVILFYGLRIEVAHQNRMLILDAIYEYASETGSKEDDLSWFEAVRIVDRMESYDSTVNRWWDFGYTRILPEEYFELVKPFIKKKKDGDAE